MNPAEPIVCVMTTVASGEDANAIGDSLLQQHLAACVQIDGPITSRYRWAGKVEVATEWRLMIKTARSTWPRLLSKLTSIHPYDEPEIILLPIEETTTGYRQWVVDQTD